MDSWPQDGRLTVLPAPLQALTAARVYDAEGNAQVVDVQAFVADLAASGLAFAPWALPTPGRLVAGIELDVSVGYGDAAIDVRNPYARPSACSPRIGTTTAGWWRAARKAQCCRRRSRR